MIQQRLRFTLFAFFFFGLVVTARLFYWQVITASSLATLAESQHLSRIEIPANRGQILTSDGFPLVSNQPAYLTYSYLPDLETPADQVAHLLAPILRPDPEDPTASAKLINTLTKNTEATLSARLKNAHLAWVPLARKISTEKKNQIESFDLEGIGFETEAIRYYSEASMSAHLLGFVGSDASGNPKGYFGLEGYYDLELKGRPGIVRQEKDASGRPILVGDYGGYQSKDGRSLKLHLDRALQRLVEIELETALEQYGAASGEIIIIDPKTGGVIVSASLPKYDPKKYSHFDRTLYKNPSVADVYEPGSTFKVLVMAAGLDANAVEPDTKCDICSGPLEIGKYTIRTWNEEYNPGIDMTQVIQRSDNIGMVFVGRKLGKEKLYDYLKKFNIGEPTGIDLQDEAAPSLRQKNKWGDVDLATASFGQGIVVTAMQILSAVSAIANDGQLMKPQVVSEIIGDKTVTIHPKPIRQVVSPEAAQQITDMMVNSVESGEAQWAKLKGYKIAGKTGTAQIAVGGEYHEEKTIASYVGFAPADDPKFAMLVKLREPTSSPWAAETAAPLWMKIAKKLFLYYSIPPSS